MVDLLEKRGVEEHERLLNDINLFRQKAETLGFIFEKDKLSDPYRIVLNCENSGEKLYIFLVDKNIFCEFYNNDSVIILPSISNNSNDFKKLFDALNDFANHNQIIPSKSKEITYPPGVPIVLPSEVINVENQK
jgi:arginine/lysine/ornithine decarboxylase